MQIKSPLCIPAGSASTGECYCGFVLGFFILTNTVSPPHNGGSSGDLGCFQLKLKLKSGEKRVGLCKVRKQHVVRLGAAWKSLGPLGAVWDPAPVLHCPFSL